MKKMIALYRTPSDPEAFLKHYRETHLPLVKKVPGMLKTEVTLVKRTLIGQPGNFLLAEMWFADAESFKAAMKSPENAATWLDLSAISEPLVAIMTGDVLDI